MQSSALNQESNITQNKLRTIKTLRLPDIDWLEIPAGSFIYGEKQSQQTLTLERFLLAARGDSGIHRVILMIGSHFFDRVNTDDAGIRVFAFALFKDDEVTNQIQ